MISQIVLFMEPSQYLCPNYNYQSNMYKHVDIGIYVHDEFHN